MPQDYAKGIPRKKYPGDISKLRAGMLVDYFVQQHNAVRRKLHYDLRLGDKNTNLFSWAARRPPLSLHEGEKIPVAQTNLHRHSYGSWSGTIPKGSYGAGPVKLMDQGKALITRTTPQTVSFSIADKKHPERYTLVNPGPKYGDNYWMLLKQRIPEHSGVEKEHYKVLKEKDVEETLKNLPEGSTVQPKIDGALQLVNIGKDKVEMQSHRISKTTGKPVIHTERFFGHRPHLNIPKELRNTILLAEVYGERNGKPISPQETSGLLNSTLENALRDKKEKHLDLKAMLFGVQKLKGKPVGFDIPYEERKKILEKALRILPKGKFHLPEEAKTSDEALDMWNKIKGETHSHTLEGVIVHPAKGMPFKAKIMPEQDVYIRGFFPGEGKYKDNAVGGFTYSHTKDGDIVGRVGTGLDDNTRRAMFEHPERFKGRIARVHSQGEHTSKALRTPAFIALHEG